VLAGRVGCGGRCSSKDVENGCRQAVDADAGSGGLQCVHKLQGHVFVAACTVTHAAECRVSTRVRLEHATACLMSESPSIDTADFTALVK
jgi:hypothetical protein